MSKDMKEKITCKTYSLEQIVHLGLQNFVY